MGLIRVILYVHLVLSALFFSLSSLEQFEYPKTMLLLGTVGVLSAYFLFVLSKAPVVCLRSWIREIEDDPIGLGFVFLLVSSVLSTAFSISPRLSLLGTQESFAGVFTVAAYTALYFITKTAFRAPAQGLQLLQATFFTSALASAYAIFQFYSCDPIIWTKTLIPNGVMRPFSTLGHPNFLSAYLAMTAPLIAYLGYFSARKRNYLALAFSALVLAASLFVIFIAQSRGSWIALASAPLVLLLFARQKRKKDRFYLAIGAVPAVMLACGWLVFRLFGAAIVSGIPSAHASFWSGVQHRMSELFLIGDARSEYWLGALRIFRRYPILGSGTDTFQLAFQHARSARYWIMQWSGVPHRAHNELLNILATQGLVGLFAILSLTFGVALAAREGWRKSSAHDRPYLVVLFAGVVAFYVQNLSSFTVNACGVLFVTMTALLANFAKYSAGSQELPENPENPSWFGNALLAAALATAFIFFHNFEPLEGLTAFVYLALCTLIATTTFATFWFNKVLFRRFSGTYMRMAAVGVLLAVFLIRAVAAPLAASVSARRANDALDSAPAYALTEIEKAVLLDRSSDLYALTTAVTAQGISDKATNVEVKKTHSELALRGYQHAASLVPRQANYHYAVGIALARRALAVPTASPDRQRATAELETAMALEPLNPIFMAGAAATEIMFGDFSRAARLAQKAVAIYPGFSVFHYQLGHVALAVKSYELAIAQLQLALKGKEFYTKEDNQGHGMPAPVDNLEARFTDSDRERAKHELESAVTSLAKLLKTR